MRLPIPRIPVVSNGMANPVHTIAGDNDDDGFTLIELIVVITLIGVLAAVVGPRFASTDVYEQRTFYDDVLQAIRFAEAKANGSGCLTQIAFNSGGFAVQIDSDCDSSNGMSATAVTNPDGFSSGYTQRQAPPSGIAYSYTVNPLVFDARGRALNSSLSVLATPAQITIGSRTITVEGSTGYVH